MDQTETPSSRTIAKLVFLQNQTRNPKRDQRLQGHGADIGDVKVARVLYYSASEIEEVTHGRH